MASQGERVLGVVDMCNSELESMVQDEIPEQEMLVVQDELPQTNPEPEMGAAAADDIPHPARVKTPPRPPTKPIMADRPCLGHRTSRN